MNTAKEKYIIDIVNKLKLKTDNNEVEWEVTSRKSQFVLKMHNAAFIIGKNEALAFNDKKIFFKVLNDIGDEIESIDQTYPLFFDKINDSPKISWSPVQVSLNQLLEDLYKSVENNIEDPNSESLQKVINELETFSNSK